MKRIPLYILALVLILSACSRKKKLATGTFVERSDTELIKALKDHNIDATWYSIKGKSKVSGEDQAFSGTIYLRMKRDSILWGMAKKMSIEGGRFLCTPEETTLLNRIDRSYMVQPTAALLGRMTGSMDFRDVQELLMGNIFLPEKTDSIIQDEVYYQVYFKSYDISVCYTVDSESLELRKAAYSWENNRQVEVEFTDYRPTDQGKDHAYNRIITVYENEIPTTKVNIKISQLDINIPKRTPFKIPRSYEKLGFR